MISAKWMIRTDIARKAPSRPQDAFKVLGSTYHTKNAENALDGPLDALELKHRFLTLRTETATPPIVWVPSSNYSRGAVGKVLVFRKKVCLSAGPFRGLGSSFALLGVKVDDCRID